MKKLALALVGVFIVALCVALAKGLSSEAMAVVVGIVCGIGASIPTSMVMLYMLSRADEQARDEPTGLNPNPQTPVMIQNPHHCVIVLGEGGKVANAPRFIGPYDAYDGRLLPGDTVEEYRRV